MDLENGKSVLKEILKALALGAGIALVLSSPQGTRKLIRGIKHEFRGRKLKREYLLRKFYYLRDRGLVSFIDNGDEAEIIITENGRKLVLKYNIDNMKIERPNVWDKKWRLVFFDIPEFKKRARDAMVFKLKDLGFLKFNASVWIYPYECQREIDFVSEFFGVGKYVHYAVLSDVTNSDALKLKFEL